MTRRYNIRTWQEIAELLGVSRDTARRWAAEDGLPVAKGPKPKDRVVANRDAVLEWYDRHYRPINGPR